MFFNLRAVTICIYLKELIVDNKSIYLLRRRGFRIHTPNELVCLVQTCTRFYYDDMRSTATRDETQTAREGRVKTMYSEI